MKNRKYWIFGIVGSLLFGVGDWLLGWVDPTPVSAAFSVLKAGHGAEYPMAKLAITLTLGALGVPFLLAGCAHMAELVKEERRSAFRYAMALLPVGWLLIHFTVSCGLFAYSWNMGAGQEGAALDMALATMNLFRGSQLVAYAFAGVPLVLLPVYVFKGWTSLEKSSQWFTPFLWMALLAAVKFVAPATPFTNGIDTFCMNGGLIVWFAYLLLKRP